MCPPMGLNNRCLWELAFPKVVASAGASEALSKFLAVCPQRQPLFFTRPSSRIVCIKEGSGASLSRALVGSLYT